MNREQKVKKIFSIINNYLVFFITVAFVITCCTMLFVTILSESLGIVLTGSNLSLAAKLTFLNVMLLSFVFFIIDFIRRKLTVERPVKRITEATEKIIEGDFSVRIEPQKSLGTDDSFNRIIECINKISEELGSVETLRADFIANVSHEMKTPLSIMQNYGTLLQAPDLSEEKRLEYAKGITESSRRMSDMITNVLKLNKLENQQIYPNVEKFNLSEQVCLCLLQYESIWEKENIEIEADIEEEIYINADYELLYLVWNNLLSNAFKFTKSGGKVSVFLKSVDEFAIITVKDTGCGMSKETGAHIFEKFYQGDTSHSTKGNGLGLALVKRVIDILGGEISVESELSVGSSFSVKVRKS